LSAEFAAGPNPVSRSAGKVVFFRQGKRVDNATLTVYDVSGNVVNKIKVVDKALGSQDRRSVGEWNLRDARGALVSEGSYLVRGVVKTSDGKKEKVSVVVGVR
jgi:flagellar hook assembly protein FlgD